VCGWCGVSANGVPRAQEDETSLWAEGLDRYCSRITRKQKSPDRGGRGGVVLGVPLVDAFVGFRNLRVVDVFDQQVIGLGVVGLDVRPRPGLSRIFLTLRNLVQLTDDIVSALVTHAFAFRSPPSPTSGISIA